MITELMTRLSGVLPVGEHEVFPLETSKVDASSSNGSDLNSAEHADSVHCKPSIDGELRMACYIVVQNEDYKKAAQDWASKVEAAKN